MKRMLIACLLVLAAALCLCFAAAEEKTNPIAGGWTPVGEVPAEWWGNANAGEWKRIYFFPGQTVVLTSADETAEYPCSYSDHAVNVSGIDTEYSIEGDRLTLSSGGQSLTLEKYVSDLPFEYEINNSGEVRIIATYIKPSADVAFPAEIEGYPVTDIECTFRDLGGIYRTEAVHGLKIAYIPEGVRVIGRGVFSNQADLRYCPLPSTLLSIGDSAFEGCTALKAVELPENITIKQFAFRNTGIETLTLPNSLRVLLRGAFNDMKELKTLNIACDSIILEQNFNNCPKLEEVNLLSSWITLEKDCFMNCPAIRKVNTQPDMNLYIGSNHPLLSSGSDFEGKEILSAAAEDMAVQELEEKITEQTKNLEDRQLQLQRWIEGGKKSEADIEKLKKKIEQGTAELQEMQLQLTELKTEQEMKNHQ